MRHTVTVLDGQDKLHICERRKKLIRDAVRAVLAAEAVDYPCLVTVRLINNRQMRALNNRMRGISKTTDVLSFPSGDDVEEDLALHRRVDLGDVAVNVERAEKQRKMYGHGLDRELAFLTAHSTLHLLGYDHEDAEGEREMIQKQTSVLHEMGLDR